MKFDITIVGLVSLFVGLGDAAATWPAAIDELEDVMFLQTGHNARGLRTHVTPCGFSEFGAGRQTAAEWLRIAFHDMATANVFMEPRGGVDASIAFELDNGENIGTGFATSLQMFAAFKNKHLSVADMIALGAYASVRACGGPVIPMRGGRTDAIEANNKGVPSPSDGGPVFANRFYRMGFDEPSMIQMVACGHAIGGVHSVNFPDIVLPNTAPNGYALFDTTLEFDNQIVTRYLAGPSQTVDPLVIGAARGKHADLAVFNRDGNETVTAMAQAAAFNTVCSNILQRMIEVVPTEVTLSDVIAPYEVKPSGIQLTLSDNGNQLQFTGEIRVRTTSRSVTGVQIVYQNRNGGAGGTITGTASGTANGFDDSFTFYTFSASLPAGDSISSFTVVVSGSGGTTTFDNNGAGFPVQDSVVFQAPNSCFSGGTMTVVAAVRNGGAAPTLDVTQKSDRTDGIILPQLTDNTVVMTLVHDVGPYTLYTASAQIASAAATTFDVISGSSIDGFKKASALGNTCAPIAPGTSSTTTASSSSTTSQSTTTTPVITTTSSTSQISSLSSTSSSSLSSSSQTTSSSVLSSSSTTSSSQTTTVISSTTSSPISSSSSSQTSTSSSSQTTSSSSQTTTSSSQSTASSSTQSTTSQISSTTSVLSSTTTPVSSSSQTITVVSSTTTTPVSSSSSSQATTSLQTTTPQVSTTSSIIQTSSTSIIQTTSQSSSSTTTSTTTNQPSTTTPLPSSTSNTLTSSSQSSTTSQVTTNSPTTTTSQSSSQTTISSTTTSALATPSHLAAVGNYQFQGCWTETQNVRALTGARYTDPQMTISMCASKCSAFTYFSVEYGEECYCGNSLNSGSTQAPLGDCNFICPGNSLQYCGAGNRMELFKGPNVAPPQPTVIVKSSGSFNYYGCWTEPASGGRALAAAYYPSNVLTVPQCVAACQGYKYAGTEYSEECYCANSFTTGSVLAPDGDCSMTCAGNTNTYCGGPNRLTVYINNGTEYKSDGCWTDSQQARTLTGANYAASDMSVEKCQKLCDGYAVFGVEYGTECWCGNTVAATSSQAPLSDCSFNCPGDSTEKCGAGDRMNLYRRAGAPFVPPSNKATIGGYKYSSCRTEASNGVRALSSASYVNSTAMTNEYCSQRCAGFNYFGTEYGQECYCGDSFNTGSVVAAESDCSFKCPGDATELCGAGNRLTVYERA